MAKLVDQHDTFQIKHTSQMVNQVVYQYMVCFWLDDQLYVALTIKDQLRTTNWVLSYSFQQGHDFTTVEAGVLSPKGRVD